MDFFEHQDAARRNTRVMVVLYLIAVAGVVLAVDLVVAVTYLGVSDIQLDPRLGPLAWLRQVPDRIYIAGAIGTVVVIFTASVVQILQLTQGGSAVAKMVGARAVSPRTTDPLEKRFLNVIEEMAIASGVRVPQAFVMDDETGINAFAAGYDVSNAVVAVTRGTLTTLSRDELAGVVAHEFSHILNGDMWLNIKMIGVLSGIVFIGSIGGFLIRNAPNSDDSKATAALFVIGVMLFVIGSVGLFFARLIKAAVSRQREFLADASSVQFTRNPDGIAGALDQIGASGRGALIANRYAEDMSHMYFGQGVSVWISGLFATHPPIGDRIDRVRPGFQPVRYRQARDTSATAAEQRSASDLAGVAGFAGAADVAGHRASDKASAWGRSAAESAKLVGTLDAGKVNYAGRLLAQLAPDLRAAMKETEGACAVLVASLLAPKKEVMAEQAAALRASGKGNLADRAVNLMPFVMRLGRGFDLTVIDLCLPAIKAATEEEKRSLVAALETVAHADRRVSLHEFVVLTLVKTQLAPRPKPGSLKTKPLSAVRAEMVTALSLVAFAGRKPGSDPACDREMGEAFLAGAKMAALNEAQLLRKDQFSLDGAGRALTELASVAPLAKAIVVKSLFAVVTADGTIRLMEAELMRLIGAVLECPLPPLMEDVDPATLLS